MKRAAALLFAFLLGSAVLSAQAIDQYRPQKFDLSQNPLPQKIDFRFWTIAVMDNCEVPMQVQQAPGGTNMEVFGRSGGVAQRVRLTLTSLKPAQIAGARVTVHGLPPAGRLLRSKSAPGTSSEIAKTLEVNFSSGDGHASSTDLTVPGFTSVSRIDLVSVTYADGSTWNTSANHTCHAVPDRLMLLSSR
jgi:hypothetical protein